MLYTFREEVIIRTTVEANSEEEAWQKLYALNIDMPECMEMDGISCEIIDIGQGVSDE